MGFLSTSVISSPIASGGTTSVATAQGVSTRSVTAIPTAVASAVGTTIGTAAGAVVGTVAVAENTATSFLAAAIKSVDGVFASGVNALASGLDGALSGIFSDTNNTAASTTTTQISDPLATNLLNQQLPSSGMFGVGSLQSGSSQIGIAGQNSTFGSLASSMTGTQLSTVLDRYNLDSSSNLTGVLANSLTGQALYGLLGEVGSVVGTVVGTAAGAVGAVAGGALGTAASVVNTTEESAAVAYGSTVSAALSSLGADQSAYLGTANGVSTLAGLSASDVGSFYGSDLGGVSLLSSAGAIVDTLGSGVSAQLANAIVSLAGNAGCDVGGYGYNSYGGQTGAYNLGLYLASVTGMGDLLSAMMSCGLGPPALGQNGLTTAFIGASSRYPSIALTLLGGIVAKTVLNTAVITSGILTNSSLVASDLGTVGSIMSGIGTTTLDAYTVPEISDVDLNTYNSAIMASSPDSFLNAAMGTTTMAAVLGGYAVPLQPDGTYGLY